MDAIIIGSGQGGGPLAGALARAGQSVALIEAEAVGGTCVNRGCTPTKTMVASARIAYLARRAADYGVECGPVRVDMGVVRMRKRAIVEQFRSGSEAGLNKAGVELIYGSARFVDAKTIEVNGEKLSAEKIFINVGARPRQLENCEGLDSTSIMELDIVPEHLLVIGGGYVGTEFGQMFRRFGSQVTMLVRGNRFLSREDEDVAEAMLEMLQEDGIDVHFNTPADQRSKFSYSHLLMAAGRVPNTDQLNLEAAGVATDKGGFVQVNEQLETNVPGIYAIGDCKGGPAFTHISYDDFRILRANLLEGGKETTTGRMVPYTMFTDPQLARVGLSEKEALKAGYNIAVAKIPMSHVARALELAETRGFMKAIVDLDTEQILGCAILGIEGGELMSMIEIAMMGKVPYTALRDSTFAHPTLAEALNTLFSQIPSK